MKENIIEEILKVKEEFAQQLPDTEEFDKVVFRLKGNVFNLEQYRNYAIRLAAMAVQAAEQADKKIKSEEKPVMVSITDVNQLGKRNG